MKSTAITTWQKRKDLKQKCEISAPTTSKKCLWAPGHQGVDTTLLEWFKQVWNKQQTVPTNGPLLIAKGNTAASLGEVDFKATFIAGRRGTLLFLRKLVEKRLTCTMKTPIPSTRTPYLASYPSLTQNMSMWMEPAIFIDSYQTGHSILQASSTAEARSQSSS